MRRQLLPILLSSLLLVACGDSKPDGSERREYVDNAPARHEADEAFQSSARAAANRLQLQLQTELKQALEQGGPAHAIDVCSRRGQAIAMEVSQETGLRVRRVSDRYRNSENQAPYWQQVVLERFRAAPDLEDTTFTVQGSAVWMKPIRIGVPVCLQCHGKVETLSPEVRERLAALYPNDMATGFSEGDLRGAFFVR